MLSGSHGKPYANWALLPDASYAVEANRRSSLDEDVCIEVGARLRETIEELGIGRPASLYRSSEGTVDLITGFKWVQHQIKSGFFSR
jgi:hypothetical protein